MKQLIIYLLLFCHLKSYCVVNVTLVDAMRFAKESSHSLKSAEQRLNSSSKNELSTFLKFGPSVSFSWNDTWDATKKITQEDSTNVGSFKLTQSVSGLWKNYSNFKNSSILNFIANQNFMDAEQKSELLGATSYLNYQLALEQLAISKASLKTSEKNYSDSNTKYIAGDLNKDEFLKIKLQYSKNLQDLSTAENNVIVVKQSMCLVIGISNCDEVTVENLKVEKFLNKVNFHFEDLKSALEKSFKKNTVLLISQAKIEQADLNKSVTLNSYVPDVSVFADYETYFHSPQSINDTKTAGVTLSWNFFDSGSQFFKFLANRSDALAAREDLEANKIDLQKEVIFKYYEFNNYFNTIQIAKNNEETTYETLNLEAIRFENGQISALEYVTAQDNYNSALANLVQTAINFQVSYLTFQTLLGDTPKLE